MDLARHGRILYVSMADVTQPNGPGVNEREFLLSLYERLGARMHALLPAPRHSCKEIDLARTTFYRHPHRWNPAGFLLQQYELYRQTRRFMQTGQFDLIVVRLSILPLAFYLLRRSPVPFAIKTLEDVQGFTRNGGLKGCVAKALGPLNGWLFRRIVPRAIAIDCCTETYVRRHQQDYRLSAQKLLLVENATNVERFAARPTTEAKAALSLSGLDPILGFVGGSPEARGGLQMLELASRLAADYPSLGVVIVGLATSGILQRRAKALGLEDRTWIPGVVPYEMIPSYVNSFDLGFALDRPERIQVTGNSYQKVRQYLACGKPVVTCLEASSELVQRGLVENVEADDLASLEAAARRLLARSQAMKERHAEKARQFVCERLSTRTAIKRRLQFWERSLAGQLDVVHPRSLSYRADELEWEIKPLVKHEAVNKEA